MDPSNPRPHPASSSATLVLLAGLLVFGLSVWLHLRAEKLAWPSGQTFTDTASLVRDEERIQGVSTAGFALGIGLILLGAHHLVRVPGRAHGDQPEG